MKRYNRKSLAVVTPQSSAVQLIATQDMKNFLRVDITTDDALIEEFIKTAQEVVAQYLRRSILTTTYDFTMDNFGGDNRFENSISEGVHELPKYMLQGGLNAIDLPMPPIISITTIKTYSRDNTESTFAAASYRLDTAGRVYLNEGYNWPTELRDQNGVVIRFVAGWGYTSVPLPVKQAIRQYAAAMYDCRKMCEMPQEIMDMLGPWRILDPMGMW